MNNRHVYILAAILAIAGASIMFWRVTLTGLPLVPGEKADAWVFERQIEFEGEDGPVRIRAMVPGSSNDKAVAAEQIVAHRYGTQRTREGENRVVTLATRRVDGPQAVFLKAIIHKVKTANNEQDPEPEFVRPALDGKPLVAARNLLEIAEQRSADDATLVSALIGAMNVNALADSLSAITQGKSTEAGRADAVSAVLSLRGIAARRVNGVSLSGDFVAPGLRHWVEVYLDNRWTPYSVETGAPSLPSTFFPVWRGSDPMVTLTGGVNLKTSMTLRRVPQRVLDQVLTRQNPMQENLIKYSLYSLPYQTQRVFRVLMVIPFGIIMLVFVRNVIGIKTLGTFMPVLIGLALHSTYLTWGVAVFVGIVAAGLLFRLYLEHLKLLLVPRLAAVLIFVILIIALLSMVTNAMGIAQGLAVSLFPIVIMTMTIERLSVLWDERGALEAIKQTAATLVFAVLICIAIAFPIIEYLFFTFPELLLVMMAIALLLGRYTGYRLLELGRFRALSDRA